jgi:hypothetical protein
MDAQLPELDSRTLLHLTKQIRENLKKPIEALPKVPRPPRVKREKKPNAADQPPREIPSVAVTPSSGGKRQDAGKKKRLGSGQAKGPSNVKSDVNSMKLGRRVENKNTVSKSRLEEEVMALGGEKEDMELILDAGSDSEMEGIAVPISNGLEKGLRKDLHRLVVDLGIEKLEKRELAFLSSEADVEEHRGIEKETIALQGRENPYMDTTAEKQPRNSAPKSSSKLVIPLEKQLLRYVSNLNNSGFAAL